MTELKKGERRVELVSPKGSRILGTLERVHGCAGLSNIVETETGELRVDYDGHTKIFWDEQETVKNSSGESVFLCENGDMWAQSQLVRRDA